MSFEDQTLLVTGARKGIGRSIAERFARSGARVLAHVRNSGDADETLKAIRSAGGEAIEVACDLLEEGALERALKGAGGPIHHLINNAGSYPVEPIEALSPAGFDHVVKANLGTAYRAIRAMQARWKLEPVQAPSIVNISSIESLRPAFGHAHYASAKAGLDMLTKVAAVEMAPVRVNSVAPGLIDYPELRSLWPEGVERYLQRALLPRLGTGDDVAAACLFLCSEQASWMTGQVLVVDGGVSAAPSF